MFTEASIKIVETFIGFRFHFTLYQVFQLLPVEISQALRFGFDFLFQISYLRAGLDQVAGNEFMLPQDLHAILSLTPHPGDFSLELFILLLKPCRYVVLSAFSHFLPDDGVKT